MKASNRPLARHDFLWIKAACRDAVCARIEDASLRPVIGQWLSAGKPLIVARQSALAEDTPTARIAAGLALPPASGKRRLALSVAADEIKRHAAPPTLTSAIPALPTHWCGPSERLVAAATALGTEFRVFGSAAWQSLTGLAYLRPSSDLDLLWRPLDSQQLERTLALLLEWEQACGARADGEIVFGKDSAVAWREWSQREAQQALLVKRTREAVLCARRELLALLEATARAPAAR